LVLTKQDIIKKGEKLREEIRREEKQRGEKRREKYLNVKEDKYLFIFDD
tara:strand:+ start:516 stop:662 length:147 start_codon:yes stop_codon:yes gene_type:complete